MSRNPLAIHCYSCGAPAEFDIIRQNYLCRNCGSETGIQDPIGKVAEWQKQQQAFIQESKNDFTATICSCPNCGARVTMVASEVTENCDFCNGKLVSRDFVNQEQFPECIIPFFITLPEAQERVKAWAKAYPQFGIVVLCPGFVRTELVQSLIEAKRLVVAEAVVCIISPETFYQIQPKG